ncbi:MAG: hypothetical protein WEA58_13565 [Balneolaceae bacterium]
MNKKAQFLLFLSWMIIGSILVTNEIQLLSYLGWFFLGSGLMAFIYNVIQWQIGSKDTHSLF